MADEFIVIIPNEAIRRFEKTDGGYYVYVWGRKWLPDGYVSDATAEWYFKINQTYVKRDEEVPEIFRLKVINLMSQLDDDHIFLEDDKWHVTSGWLVGGIYGMYFVARNLDEAVDKMIRYFDRHIGHDSIVGGILEKSGWPDIKKVKAYLESEDR